MKKEAIKDLVREAITEDMLIEHYDGVSKGAKFISKFHMPEIKSTVFVYWYYDDINGKMCDESRKQAAKLHYTAEIYGDVEDVTICGSIDITDFGEKRTEKLFADFKELIMNG